MPVATLNRTTISYEVDGDGPGCCPRTRSQLRRRLAGADRAVAEATGRADATSIPLGLPAVSPSSGE